jgi:NAD(P)-dependent dehydrogenase (short-subunit alcohol dehydrogenase family)
MDELPRPFDLFSLDGRVALVTGASAGLGAEVARVLAGAGAKIVAVARRGDRLEALAAELPACAPVVCDLSVVSALPGVVDAAHDAFGPVDILCNVAGTLAAVVPAESETEEFFADAVALHLFAPFRLSQLVFPDMKASERGAIVNITSFSGMVGVKGIPQASYAATKRGLSGLTTELAVQWARYGIRVNAVAAGFFESELTAPMYGDERMRTWIERNTPLPVRGQTTDIATAVLWLASDAGRYVTGQTVVVDGGWTAR